MIDLCIKLCEETHKNDRCSLRFQVFSGKLKGKKFPTMHLKGKLCFQIIYVIKLLLNKEQFVQIKYVTSFN